MTSSGLAAIRGAVPVGRQLITGIQSFLKLPPLDFRLSRSAAVQSHSLCSPSAAQDQLLSLRGTHPSCHGGLLGFQRSRFLPLLERSANLPHKTNPTASIHGHWSIQPLCSPSAVLHHLKANLPLASERVGSIAAIDAIGRGVLRRALSSGMVLARASRQLPVAAWAATGLRMSNSERIPGHRLLAPRLALLHGSPSVLEGSAVKEAAVKSAALAGAASVKGASSEAAKAPRKRFTHKRLMRLLGLVAVLCGGAVFSTREPGVISEWSFWVADLATPLFRLLDPETAHELAIASLALGLGPQEHRPDPASLGITLWGRHFPNPVGLAAGWDKDARAVEGILSLGFGFMEVGSVTPAPQSGNPRPRVFRLPEQKAVINRYGFNSEGIPAVAYRLGMFHGRRQAAEQSQGAGSEASRTLGGPKLNSNKKAGSSGSGAKGEGQGGDTSQEGTEEDGSVPMVSPNLDGESSHVAPAAADRTPFLKGLMGVNLGKNKWTADAASDFVQGVYTLAQYADFLVINVSSPNTPGLRKLQGRRELHDLIKKIVSARNEMQWGEKGPPPLLVKVAPDLSAQDMADIAAVALAVPFDGLIIGNTTVTRPDSVLGLLHVEETGGLSGRPLFDLSTAVLHRMYSLTKGKIPLVGCGGVSSGEDAYRKIRAGASLVQLYTGLVYDGPGIVPRIKKELAQCLERDGFKSVEDAIGADHRPSS